MGKKKKEGEEEEEKMNSNKNSEKLLNDFSNPYGIERGSSSIFVDDKHAPILNQVIQGGALGFMFGTVSGAAQIYWTEFADFKIGAIKALGKTFSQVGKSGLLYG